jgi:two-component system chemotaxis sensor kinase CheA
MDNKEALFQEKLLATFRVEAEEHIAALSKGILAIEQKPVEATKQELIQTIFREAHSLKGAARAVNQQVVQALCQSMENVLSAWKQGNLQECQALFDTLYATVDWISKGIGPQSDLSDLEKKQSLKGLLDRLDALLANKGQTPPSVQEAPPTPKDTTPALPPADQTIRISLRKLNKLFEQVEEMLMIKFNYEHLLRHLKEIHLKFLPYEKEWVSLDIEMQKHLLKELLSQLGHLVSGAGQEARLMGSLIDTLLEDTKQVLMQPFSTLLEAFPRMVRDLSHALGKEVHLQILGADIEIDKRILEEIKDPLIHLIRNAIDHGLETPDARASKNKTREGKISIAVTQVGGNSVEITLKDDGQGIDLEKVKASAVRQGILGAKGAADLTKEEAIRLIFQSGLSTSTAVTELSGRGLGLGIVLEKADKLGGHVIVETQPQVGTTFRLLLPLTLSTFRGVHVEVRGKDFIIPTHSVKRVLNVERADIKSVASRPVISVHEEMFSFILLGDLFGLVAQGSRIDEQTIPVVVVKAGERAVAFGVDRIVSEQEVLVKSLGQPLLSVRYVLGSTILERGQVVPILNPSDLVHSCDAL